MAVLHDGHARALEIDELALRALEGGEGESGGTGVEVVDTSHVSLLAKAGFEAGSGALYHGPAGATFADIVRQVTVLGTLFFEARPR
jgi:hypothetical protein